MTFSSIMSNLKNEQDDITRSTLYSSMGDTTKSFDRIIFYLFQKSLASGTTRLSSYSLPNATNSELSLINQQAISFMKSLLNEDPTYDKEVWSEIEQNIKEYKLSYRDRLND